MGTGPPALFSLSLPSEDRVPRPVKVGNPEGTVKTLLLPFGTSVFPGSSRERETWAVPLSAPEAAERQPQRGIPKVSERTFTYKVLTGRVCGRRDRQTGGVDLNPLGSWQLFGKLLERMGKMI